MRCPQHLLQIQNFQIGNVYKSVVHSVTGTDSRGKSLFDELHAHTVGMIRHHFSSAFRRHPRFRSLLHLHLDLCQFHSGLSQENHSRKLYTEMTKAVCRTAEFKKQLQFKKKIKISSAVTSVDVGRTPLCSFILLCCLFLTPSASLDRNSSAEAPPTVCVPNQ